MSCPSSSWCFKSGSASSFVSCIPSFFLGSFPWHSHREGTDLSWYRSVGYASITWILPFFLGWVSSVFIFSRVRSILSFSPSSCPFSEPLGCQLGSRSFLASDVHPFDSIRTWISPLRFHRHRSPSHVDVLGWVGLGWMCVSPFNLSSVSLMCLVHVSSPFFSAFHPRSKDLFLLVGSPWSR